MYKQLWLRSWAMGFLAPARIYWAILQVTSPLWVCLPICKRKFLAQVVAEVPCLVRALWIGTRPRPSPLPPKQLGLLVPRQGINKQAEVISLFLGNKAGVVWRGVRRAKSARWKWAKRAEG